jgi:hypothetical protein
MGDYQMHHSSIIHPKGQKTPTHGAAGVIILINNKYAATYTKMEVNPSTAGYLAHVTIGTQNATLTHIIGTYMPNDKPLIRRKVYDYIESITKQCNGTSHNMMTAGDWNATLYPTDRSEGNHNPNDQQHAQKCADLNIKPTSGPNREHTYHCYEHHTLQHSSRIDDIYIFSPQETISSERCIEVGGSMDHKMLVQHIPAAMLQMAINPIAPQAPQKQAKQLQYPVPKEALLATKHEIYAQLTTKLEQTAELIRNAHDIAITMLDGDHTAKQIKQVRIRLNTHINIEEMAEDIMTLMHQAHDIMLETCPNKTPFTKMYIPRTVGREYERLNTQIIELKRIRQEANTKMKHPQCIYSQPKTTVAQEILAQCPGDTEKSTEWRTMLGNTIEDTQKQMNQIRMEFNKEKWAAGRK